MAAKPPDKASWRDAQFSAKFPQYKSRAQGVSISRGHSGRRGKSWAPAIHFLPFPFLQATPGKAAGAQTAGGSKASPVTGSPAGTAASTSGAAVASDNLLVDAKKARVQRTTFRETDVLSERGVWRLYDSFQRLPMSGKPGHEASDMARVAGLYNDWARQLAPSLHPTDVLTKCRCARRVKWLPRDLWASSLALLPQ